MMNAAMNNAMKVMVNVTGKVTVSVKASLSS